MAILRTLTVYLILGLAVCVQAQVGFKTAAFVNPTGVGSAALGVSVFYPALAPGGQNAPIQPAENGHPSIVFLHGAATFGSAYFDLATIWAGLGYVVVLNETAWLDPELQRHDGAALYPAMIQANQAAGDFFEGAFDMARVGLAGHSMGGGNTIRILATNPGYRAGFAFACFDGGGWANTYAPQVTTPLGFVHAMNDAIVPWTVSHAFYTAAQSYTGTKTAYVFGPAGQHFNLANLTPFATPLDVAVYSRSVTIATGFFDRYVRGDPRGLEQVVGPVPANDPLHVLDQVAVERPALWTTADPVIGTSFALRALATPGYVLFLGSFIPASIPTPYGILTVDPTVAVPAVDGFYPGVASVPITVPANPSLAGITSYVQAVAFNAGGFVRLTNGVTLTVRLP